MRDFEKIAHQVSSGYAVLNYTNYSQPIPIALIFDYATSNQNIIYLDFHATI